MGEADLLATPSDARDRLIVALDVPTADDARLLIERLGDSVTFYKVGLELLFAGGLDVVRELQQRRKRVFLDVKLLDIGNTVESAIATIARLGVAFVTVHGFDQKTLRAAVTGKGRSPLKILAVTVLTSLNDDDLAEQGISMATGDLVLHRARLARDAGCDGLIASGQEAARLRAEVGANRLIVTPGIRLPGASADDQQRVMSPERAIAAGADYIVVGRPITRAADPRAAADEFVGRIRSADTAR